MKLATGSPAPNFSAPDQNGTMHTMDEFKGKWLLVYFYPKDFTSGCITEACSVRDNIDQLQKYLTVVGVSTDSVSSHKKFETKYSLPYTLLSDNGKQMVKAYGTDNIIFAKRTSFLINPKGTIVKIYNNVKPDQHVEEVLNDLKTLVV